MKRAFDIVVAAVGLVLFSPAMAIAALVVKRDSPGPVLFRQERVGRGGRLFWIWKFRTMRHGMSGAAVTTGTDPRITRSGQFLRSTKFDELPQLINVLRGEMSLVGPRPEVPQYVEMWPVQAREKILSVRPGITDPASIEFRREAEGLASSDDPERTYVEEVLPHKVELYTRYVEAQSFVGDLVILVRTVVSIVRR